MIPAKPAIPKPARGGGAARNLPVTLIWSNTEMYRNAGFETRIGRCRADFQIVLDVKSNTKPAPSSG